MKLKRSIAVLTAAALSISLFSACGRSAAKMSETTHLFTETKLTIDSEFDYVNNSVYIDGKFYLLGDYTESKIVPIEEGMGGGGAMPIRPLMVETAVPQGVTPPRDEPADDSETEIAEDTETEIAEETEIAADTEIDEETEITETEIAATTSAPIANVYRSDVVVDVSDGTQYASDGSIIPPGMMEINIGHTVLAVADDQGKIINSKEVSSNDWSGDESSTNSYYNALSVSPDNKLLSMKTTTVSSTDADGNYNYEQTSQIMQYDESLTESVFFDVSEAMKKVPKDQINDEQVSADTFLIDDAGRIYLSTYMGIFVFDSSGNFLFSILNDNGNGGNSYSYINGIYNLGGVVAASVGESKQENDIFINTTKLYVIDPATGKYGASYPFDYGRGGSVFAGNKDYPLVISDGAQLFAYDYITGEETLLIDFLASGLSVDFYNNFMILDSDRFAVVTMEYPDGNNIVPGGGLGRIRPTTSITVFTRIDPSTVKPREVVTVYNFYSDREFLRFASEFNKTSTEYEIDVKTYNSNYDQTNTALTTLNNDIISGNIPDILMLTSEMPYDSYAAKGLFYDLNNFIDKDNELTRDKLSADILNALSTNGKLYSITRNYSIIGLMGKTSIFGSDMKLTAEKLKEVTAAYPDAKLMGQWTQNDFVNIMIGMQLDSYVDKKTGTVNFDSPEFIELLNLAKSHPAELTNEDYDNMGYNYETMYRDNHTLLSYSYVSDFKQIVSQRYSTFGEEVTFMGFPNPNNSGIMITPDLEMAVMSRGNRDAAWEVVKAYLMRKPEYSYSFSIFNDEIKELAEEAKKTPSYTDPVTGEVIEQPNTYWLGNETFEYPNNTDADNQRIYDIMANIGGVTRTDNELMKIIEEEAAAFFAGSKTAEECAKLIQNRASTYVAESR
jgi:ABC-type glycerol-3-phosphate transport system substrate-binding protein